MAGLPILRVTSLSRRVCWQTTPPDLTFGGASRVFSVKAGGLPAAPVLHRLTHSDDMRQASDWLSRFQRSKVLKDHVEITFSRSSGPGGQVCPLPTASRASLNTGIECQQG